MKKTLILSMILLAFSLPAAADTIIFKDDFEMADEGAAGWIGMIFNEQKAGELSEVPELVIR